LLIGSIFLVVAALVALRATNVRGEKAEQVSGEQVSDVVPEPVGA
jgi:hypothetical protein